MDPNACWKDIRLGFTEHNRERIADGCDALITWLEKDGYPPINTGFEGRRDLLRYLRDLRAVAEMK